MPHLIFAPRTVRDAVWQNRFGTLSLVLAAGMAVSALFSLSDGPDTTTLNATVIGSICAFGGILLRRQARDFWRRDLRFAQHR